MEKLALLIGARPKYSKGGPVVRLKPGVWKLVLAGVEDTVLGIAFPHTTAFAPCVHDAEIDAPSGLNVQVSIMVPGNESFVSAYAERIGEAHTDENAAPTTPSVR